ncbi:MAG TPA: ferredoxin-type protein NapF [Pararhizobium sp.]|uniref:ferredoxin-type protein NapF n=1 Tax=Pararhizobium sp. TaxID=1977563 RepID=UPI002B7E7EA4|nr:ferredoxin-type protein NapF [Pararhizobium sp.]HTO31428.1 ferredoxin-type protein NapF [Pararhizobium sp.]
MPASISTRRAFLTGRPMVETAVVYPPGVTEQSVLDCSGCGKCSEACPSKIIVMRSGLPTIDFDRGECTFCGTCAERCPERVFPPATATRFPHHAVIEDSCLAVNYVDCQACRDGCPADAIRFRPRRGGPFLPSLDADACTGCGACIGLCPTASISMRPVSREVAHV